MSSQGDRIRIWSLWLISSLKLRQPCWAEKVNIVARTIFRLSDSGETLVTVSYVQVRCTLVDGTQIGSFDHSQQCNEKPVFDPAFQQGKLSQPEFFRGDAKCS